MMKTSKRKIQMWKFITLLATLPIIIFVVSCQKQVAADSKVVSDNSGMTDHLSNFSASENNVHSFAQNQPMFAGGADSLRLFIQNNVEYPTKAREDHIEGKVFVQFIVETDGSVSNTEVIKGIRADCDKEALRVVKMMPKWTPGRMDDGVVRVRFVVPVNFKMG